VLKAPVPVDGSQIAFCAIRRAIKLIEDCEVSSQFGHSRRLRGLPLRRGPTDRRARALHPLQPPPRILRLRLVAPENDTSANREFAWSTSIDGKRPVHR
jgi:hypothetical protein